MSERVYQDPDGLSIPTDHWWTFGDDNSKIADEVINACTLFDKHAEPWFTRWEQESKRLWTVQ